MSDIAYTQQQAINNLCARFKKYNSIDPYLFEKFDVKKGLRNADGSGVLAGLTRICNVHGYIMSEGDMVPIDGELIYRGININDIVDDCITNNRFGFEEVIYLLIFGVLPTHEELDYFTKILAYYRDLPDGFTEDMILKVSSPSIMNMLARNILALYRYDDDPDNSGIEFEFRRAIEIIARMSLIMVNSYQAKRKNYDQKSMFFHPIRREESIAQSILSTLRPNREYTDEEAKLLDLCLILHAEHGGGNNSTFTCRVLTSSGTDAYAAYSGAIGSLKGPKHGGANIKVMEMLGHMKAGIHNYSSRDEVRDFLIRLMKKEEGDHSGLIYGMGHAVYTKSDPRAIILKKNAKKLAEGTDFQQEFELLELVESLTPEIFAEVKNDTKTICANVDLYSGLVYRMLKIPQDLFTPLFATSRIAGWAAHRMEELISSNRIIRPAYKPITKAQPYVSLKDRSNP